jgi:hypothetical protein
MMKPDAAADRKDGPVRFLRNAPILTNFSRTPVGGPIIEQGLPNLQGHLPRARQRHVSKDACNISPLITDIKLEIGLS